MTEHWQDKEGRPVLLCWASCLHHAGQEGQWVYTPTKSNQSKVPLINRIVQVNTCKSL